MSYDQLQSEIIPLEIFAKKLLDQREFDPLSPLNKRRSRAVLTKEQAIEVYKQKLANEAPSSATSAPVAANAAVVARRLNTAYNILLKSSWPFVCTLLTQSPPTYKISVQLQCEREDCSRHLEWPYVVSRDPLLKLRSRCVRPPPAPSGQAERLKRCSASASQTFRSQEHRRCQIQRQRRRSDQLGRCKRRR